MVMYKEVLEHRYDDWHDCFLAAVVYYLDSARGGEEDHLRRLEEAVAVTGFGNEMLKFNGTGRRARYLHCRAQRAL